MLLQTTLSTECATKPSDSSRSLESDSTSTHILDYAPAPGWTVHVTKEGRLYYCNHVTRTAGWLPPAEAWRCDQEFLPYGWERAVDNSGRTYYINHVNKTTTYEAPLVRNLEPAPIPEPRFVTLERSAVLGFGFVAGSEKPVIVRFVTEGGPSVDKLLPGDQILFVNDEDVKMAPREHVISLVRACIKTVNLVVCQPTEQHGIRKSTLLSASKRARLRTKPSRVRFAESVCVNGAPLFPPSAFSLGDLCVAPMANVLKVFLENGQTKSFKYDAWTTVSDVVTSLESKLCLQASEHFSLVVEHIKSLKRNKLTLLDPSDTLARIASRPGAHKLRCLFRVAFVPSSAAALAQKDLHALDYLYTQCCNDVIQERFAPELQYDTALRLAALHIYQHALANNIQPTKLTVKSIEHDFGLERFIPASLFDNVKRKEIRKLVGHFLKLHASMAGVGKQLTALQAKLHYLDIVAQLPSYGAKCFSAGPRADTMERVILVSPKFGLSQITGTRTSVFNLSPNNISSKTIVIPQPVPIASIDSIRRIEVRSDDEVTKTVLIRLQSDKTVSISLEERDASELVLVLKGYYKICCRQSLSVDQDEIPPMEDLAPPFLSQHKVVPEKWSYTNQVTMKTICFAVHPIYQPINRKTNGLYNTMGRHSKLPFNFDNNMNSTLSNRNHTTDYQTVVSMEILETGKDDEVLRRVQEMRQLVESSEKYLTEQENLERLQALAEWQETSVDESDNEEPKLKHSDSLLLLSKAHTPVKENRTFTNAAIELLRTESIQSESDNDSLYESPKRQLSVKSQNRVSFGLTSPDMSKSQVFDSDLIDLTLLPPPATPDELDCALPVPISRAPKGFDDSFERLNFDDDSQTLDEFLASVTVPPPTTKVTPAIELTPEEIMSFIIPPPPMDVSSSRRNSDCVIEYATVERKGAFSCCAKGKKIEEIRPLPRRSSDEKPPERPPKTNQERQRSQSLGAKAEPPPKLPPRGENQAPPHLFLPPKKPPLPPLPPLEVLRNKKVGIVIGKSGERTAGIGSPHLQRSRNFLEMDSTNSSPDHEATCNTNCDILLAKTDVAMASLLVRLDQVAAQCTTAQVHGGGTLISEEKFEIAKEELTSQSLQLVTSSKMLVIAMSKPNIPELPENLAICLRHLRRLVELCQDLTNYTTAPLQTRNLILKVHDVTSAFRHLVISDFDRMKTIEEHLANEAERLANVLATLLRSLRVFSP